MLCGAPGAPGAPCGAPGAPGTPRALGAPCGAAETLDGAPGIPYEAQLSQTKEDKPMILRQPFTMTISAPTGKKCTFRRVIVI